MAANDDSLTVHLTLTAAPSSPRVSIEITSTTTPTKLRELAAEATTIPLTLLKLIFRGRLIGNDVTKAVVAEYKLENDSVLHCMGKPAASTTAAASAPAPAAAAPAGSSVSLVPPAATTTPSVPTGQGALNAALATLRQSNSSDAYLTAVTTLEKILTNITDNPMEEKYRKVKRNNAAFQRRLGGLTGGHEAMLAAGFVISQEGEESYVIQASADAWPKLLATKAAVQAAVRQAKSATTTTSAPPPPVVPPAAPVMPFGGAGQMPDMSAVSSLMSDPHAFQSLLQNPQIQNAMQNDPRLAGNPQLQQSLQMMASNPAMMERVRQSLTDPNMQAQMAQAMNDPAMQSHMANAMQGMQNTGASNNQNANNNSSQQGDEEMTEEEMLEEAIRRSLQDS